MMGERKRNEEQIGDQIANKYVHAHIFLNGDPCALTFHESCYLIVFDCKVWCVSFCLNVRCNPSDTHVELNIQANPYFECNFQNLWSF